jgi:hypothetical protein
MWCLHIVVIVIVVAVAVEVLSDDDWQGTISSSPYNRNLAITGSWFL